jgi:hypothetical protein
MVFSATFNNISVISWRSVLLVEETGENHRPVASHWMVYFDNDINIVAELYLVLEQYLVF